MLKEGTGFRCVIICCGRTDLRKGIPGLATYVRLNYGLDTTEKGTLFLFCDNRADRIKGLVFEDLSVGFCYPHIFYINKCSPLASHRVRFAPQNRPLESADCMRRWGK